MKSSTLLLLSLFGLFNEHGPFIVKKDYFTLTPRTTTWALTHNLLYIDNPVGTGNHLAFSFSAKNFEKTCQGREGALLRLG